MQNLVTIPHGFLFAICAKLRVKNVYSASFLGSSNAPQLMWTDGYIVTWFNTWQMVTHPSISNVKESKALILRGRPHII